MKYEEMSDSEINLAVAKIIYPGDQYLIPYKHRADVHIFHRNNLCTVKDFCKSWADAGPIIEQNNISLSFGIWVHPSLSGLVMASVGKYSASSENPLRAAMIVFLMIWEADNE